MSVSPELTTSTAKNDILSKYVIATGSDGYTAVYSAGEINPQFGNQPVLIASSDTAGQLGPLGSDGLSRVVVPGDIAGGRYVSDLVSLKVGSLPEPGPTGPGGIAASATLSGAVADPTIIMPETLSQLTDQTQTVTATLPPMACGRSIKESLNDPMKDDPGKFGREHDQNIEFANSINERLMRVFGEIGSAGPLAVPKITM